MRTGGRRAPAAFALATALALGLPSAAAAERPDRDPPEVTAAAWISIDAATGQVIAGRDEDDRLPIASATKLMTALLTLERTDPDDVLEASDYEPSPVESQLGFVPGEELAVRDLLVALLLESANDAAVTLAEGIAGSTDDFVEEMNRRARRLGLEDTSFENPIGFDHPDNFSTAADLAALGARLMEDELFRDIVEEARIRLRSGERPRVVENRNDLVGEEPGVDGIKTGSTLGAGDVLVGSAETETETEAEAASEDMPDGPRVISVVLGAPSEAARDAGTIELLEHGLDSFVERRVLRAGGELASAPVAGGDGDEVALEAARAVSLTVLRGERIRTRVEAPDELEGPLPEDAEVGSVAVVRAGEVVGRSPLVTAAPVPEPDALAEVADTLRNRPLVVGVLGTVLVGLATVGVVSIRRRARHTDQRTQA